MRVGSLVLAMFVLNHGTVEAAGSRERLHLDVSRAIFVGLHIDGGKCVPTVFDGGPRIPLVKTDSPTIRQGMLWVVINDCGFSNKVTIKANKKKIGATTPVDFVAADLFNCLGEDKMELDKPQQFSRHETRHVFCALNERAMSTKPEGKYTFCILAADEMVCPQTAAPEPKAEPKTYEIEIQVLP